MKNVFGITLIFTLTFSCSRAQSNDSLNHIDLELPPLELINQKKLKNEIVKIPNLLHKDFGTYYEIKDYKIKVPFEGQPHASPTSENEVVT